MTNENETLIPGSRHADESVAHWTTRVWNLGWVPACGGTERPFRDRDGRRLLYCTNLREAESCYIDLDTDMPAEPRF